MNPTLELLRPPKITLPSARGWFFGQLLANIPQQLAPVLEWSDAHYRVLTSDSEFFVTADSPQIHEPLLMADDPLITNLTFVKPVQTSGTSLGEIIIMRRCLDSHGTIGYYWPTDDKAKDRWNKYTEKRLLACKPLRKNFPGEWEDCLVKFPNITLAMQGVYTSGNLDSDTIGHVICEEVHQWQAGMLAKAKGRQTRVLFPKFIVISNAGLKGDQLHQEFNNGTQQHYQVKCPGCGQYHTMRTRWEDNRPDLGGLRYDSEGCKRQDGTFDYNKLIPTIRYQMPCGYPMQDDIRIRRAASTGGRYTEPQNTGALATNRSYTYQAVTCHNIRWLDLITEKHNALRALRTGDDEPWRVYLQERESQFYDPEEHRPYQGAVILTQTEKKSTEGLPGEAARIWAADWQQGFKHLSQLTHYWLVIESVLRNCTSKVIYEGQVATDEELIRVLTQYGCLDEGGRGGGDGAVDASKNTKAILSMCYRYGLNAVMGNASGQGSFLHPDKVRRYYSPNKFICEELNMPPRYDKIPTRDGWQFHPDEPVIIMFNKAGLLKNHFFLREMKTNILAADPHARPSDYIERIIPADISEDYRKHHEAWERDHEAKRAKGMGEVEGFKQVRREDHLMSCTTYIDLLKDVSGWLGDQLSILGINQPQQSNEGTK